MEELFLWRLIIIAIIIHLPDEQKSVSVPDCSNLQELGSHKSKSLQRVAFSHIFFQKIFGYMELINTGELTHEQAQEHIKDFAQAYNANILDFDSEPDDDISNRVFDIMKSDEFSEKYQTFLQVVSGEIFRLFASGAMSYEEGDTELGIMPSYMTSLIPTKA